MGLVRQGIEPPGQKGFEPGPHRLFMAAEVLDRRGTLQPASESRTISRRSRVRGLVRGSWARRSNSARWASVR
jgi:hypothetical protein